MPVNHLLLLLHFLLTSKTGFSAEISVFVRTGASVQLDIQTQQLPEFDLFMWMNNNSDGIVRYISDSKTVRPHNSYKDRVDFNTETLSLTLKNMQKTDSGLYTARISGSKNTDFDPYRVSVIDAVEAPVLTVNSNWSSSDSCTVNFTCRAQELMINSSYQNNRCSPQEVTSHENYTLILDCSKKSIICNHSNPVSWNQDRINITQLCDNNKGKNSKRTQSDLSLPLIIVCSVAGVIIIIISILCWKHVHKKGAEEVVLQSSTLYAEVEAQEMQKLNSDCHTYDTPDRVPAQKQEETGDKRPNTTYCTVGQFQKPSSEKECTIYAAVCKPPNKKPPAISANDT